MKDILMLFGDDWLSFNGTVGRLTNIKKFLECSDCRFSGVGAMPGREEKHCLDHAKDGQCKFFDKHSADIKRVANACRNKVYMCNFINEEWGAYVVAGNRGQAKAIFHRAYKDEGKWNDIRCTTIKPISDDILIAPQCLDVPGDPVLKLLGLEYREEI